MDVKLTGFTLHLDAPLLLTLTHALPRAVLTWQ
jgi:hypothetical protein